VKNKFRWDLVWPEKKIGDSCNNFDPSVAGSGRHGLLTNELAKLETNNVTFVSSEHWFPPHDVVLQQTNVKWITVVREPMERLVSSFYFHGRGGKRCPNPLTKCAFSQWWPAEANMYVKMMNGFPGGPELLGGNCHRSISNVNLTQEHLHQAVQSLDRFHLVVTLKTIINHPKKTACAFQRVLGWSVTTVPEKNVAYKGQSSRNVGSKELEKARSANRLDLEFYQHAQELETRIFREQNCM